MTEQVICDICGCDMILEKRIESNKPYRIRRFKCSCGYSKTVFAGGIKDEEWEPENAIKCVNKMYKQQEINNQP